MFFNYLNRNIPEAVLSPRQKKEYMIADILYSLPKEEQDAINNAAITSRYDEDRIPFEPLGVASLAVDTNVDFGVLEIRRVLNEEV